MAGKGKYAYDAIKKAAGDARKAENAAIKAAAEETRLAALEAEKWKQGAKDTTKRDLQEYKSNWRGTHKMMRNKALREEVDKMNARDLPPRTRKAEKKVRGVAVAV